MTARIIILDVPAIEARLDDLCDILIDSIAAGASISFMAGIARQEAANFWLRDIGREIASGDRQLFCAEINDDLVGTVQLVTAMPPNQPHRCEIAKLIVHPKARRQGVGRALMDAALRQAGAMGKTLVTLDTRSGDSAEPLYASVGFEVAGIIPDFAWDPDGSARSPTTYMFKRL